MVSDGGEGWENEQENGGERREHVIYGEWKEHVIDDEEKERVMVSNEGEKNHKKGGLNCVFENFFFYVLDNCPQVQSLK